MKKFLACLLTVVMSISITACSAKEDLETESTTSENLVHSQITDTASDTTLEDDEPNIINGTIYAVYSDGSADEKDFGYNEKDLTPITIADALTVWTGLQFSISYEFTKDDTVVIDWLYGSSFVTGNVDGMSEDFTLYDEDSMRYFMLNSLCRSIRENFGDIDVYYECEEVDLMTLDTGVDMASVLHPAIPYNNLDIPNCYGD